MLTAILFLSGLLLYITLSYLFSTKTVPPTSTKSLSLNRKTMQSITVLASVALLTFAYGIHHFMKLNNTDLVQLTSLLGLLSWGVILRFGSRL